MKSGPKEKVEVGWLTDFYGISTRLGLLCQEVRESHSLYTCIYIFVQLLLKSLFVCLFVFSTHLYSIKYSYQIQITYTQLYGFKYSN